VVEQWGDASLVALLATELATNVVLHAGTDFMICLSRGPHRLRVELHDGSHDRPEVIREPLLRRGGRGMLMVEELAEAWGVEATPTGKVVWFEVPC
jgi:anti-sigma regulatory factor (Ser/Thr protein kinase)